MDLSFLSSIPLLNLILILGVILSIVLLLIFSGLSFSYRKGEGLKVTTKFSRNLIKSFYSNQYLAFEVKRQIDEIDSYFYEDLRVWVSDVDNRYYKYDNKYCYFPYKTAFSSLKKILYRRISLNNIRSNLSLKNINSYTRKIKKEFRDSFENCVFRITSADFISKSCGELPEIKIPFERKTLEMLDSIVDGFIDICKVCLRYRILEKIQIYNNPELFFKDSEADNVYRVGPLKKNIHYLMELGFPYKESDLERVQDFCPDFEKEDFNEKG